MRLKAPCYNHDTHTDCPDREVGCRSTCEAWKGFEAAKRVEYAETLDRHERESDRARYLMGVSYKMKKRRNHNYK
jgi:hypothetical protein